MVQSDDTPRSSVKERGISVAHDAPHKNRIQENGQTNLAFGRRTAVEGKQQCAGSEADGLVTNRHKLQRTKWQQSDDDELVNKFVGPRTGLPRSSDGNGASL